MTGTFDVFVSYSHNDLEKVKAFVEDLKESYGKLIGTYPSIFMDETIPIGQKWKSRIFDDVIERSFTVICFLSPSYFRSTECQAEWDRFCTKPHAGEPPVFPVKILSWAHVTDFTSRERKFIKQVWDLKALDISDADGGTEEYVRLVKNLVLDLHKVLASERKLTDISQNPNYHIREMKVTLENLARHLDTIFGRKGGDWRYPERKPVLVLYTGGTIGMVRSDPSDNNSPLVFSSLDHIVEFHQEKLKRLHIDIDFYSIENLLDSANIASKEWVRIAQVIEKSYEFYQGFVILHGTDTMPYTASALSFMFENLGKPVILTGAEKPPGEYFSDAGGNLINAIKVAAMHDTFRKQPIPEVCILFGNRLMRGNRVKKAVSFFPGNAPQTAPSWNSQTGASWGAFESPNCDDLAKLEETTDAGSGTVEERIDPKLDLIIQRRSGSGDFAVDKRISDEVWIVETFPGMNANVLGKIVNDNGIKGIVLKTFGTGNAPTLPIDFLSEIGKAVRSGKVVVNVTECPKGKAEVRLFETNARLFELGVVNGEDMTSEAAFCKLGCLLARHGNNTAAIKSDMQIDMRGELRYSVHNVTYRNGVIRDLFNGESQKIDNIEPTKIARATLRLYDMNIEGVGSGEIKLCVFLNCKSLDFASWSKHEGHLIATVARSWARSPQMRQHWESEVETRTVKRVIGADGLASLEVLSEGGLPVTFGALELSIFSERR